MTLTRGKLFMMSGDDFYRALLHVFFPPGSRLPCATGLESSGTDHPRFRPTCGALLHLFAHERRPFEREFRRIGPTDAIYFYSREVDGIILDAGVISLADGGYYVAVRASDELGEIVAAYNPRVIETGLVT